jgi:hypothetical protein
MHPSNFDELTKALASSTSRRHALKLIATASIGSLFGLGGVSTAFGRHNRRKARITAPSGPKGNRNCAKWCAQVFGPNTSAAGQCTSDATHNRGLCVQCGSATPPSSICCVRNTSGFCNGTAGAQCPCDSSQCKTCDSSGTCVSTCSPSQTCCSGTCRQCCADSDCTSGQHCCSGTCHQCCVDNDCPTGQTCQSGTCVVVCTPNCAGKTCGDNGCGGSCGTCPDGQRCSNGQCVPCPSTCSTNGDCCEGECCAGICCSEDQICDTGRCCSDFHCNTNNDCCSGLCCVDVCCQAGQTCVDNEHCG